MSKWIAVFAFALGLTAAASAQRASNQPTKTQVYVDCTTQANDFAGTQLCMDLRDVLATSPRYQETSKDKIWHYTLHLVSTTIDEANGTAGSSAQSVSITMGSNGTEFYVTSYALITGISRTKEQARNILADLDEQVDEIAKAPAAQ